MRIVRFPSIKRSKMSIVEFADIYGLVMEIRERNNKSLPKYFAAFQRCEVQEGCALCGIYGNGNTEAAAIRDYAKGISGQLLVRDAYSPKRTEIEVPNLI